MPSKPFFKHATPREIRIMRLSVGTNIAVILFCAAWLVRHYPDAALPWPRLIAVLLLGYFLADFASGAVHWAIDTWFDEAALGRAVAITREHHTHPSHVMLYGFLEQASLGSAPSAVVIGLAAAVTALSGATALACALMIIWLVIATCLLFGMHFHNLAHQPARSVVLRLAQRLHLVCPPRHHWVHHRRQNIHYCVVNGWANYPCDRLRLWRGLERLIAATTGLEPRSDDQAWQRQFRATGTLAAPRRPPLEAR
jgi:ubiquitin-conjugating enzyme E2 variant